MGNGNVSVGQWAEFSAKVLGLLWPSLKSGVNSGALDLRPFINDPGRIRRALVRGFASVAEEPHFRIRLGGFSNPEEAIEGLELGGVRVFDWARDIVGKLVITRDGDRDIGLVKVAVRDLGFPKRTRFDRVCERARELGLKIVPQDAALYAALQAGERIDRGELIIFAMESIAGSDDCQGVFGLDRDPGGELGLVACFGSPALVLDPDDGLVLSRT